MKLKNLFLMAALSLCVVGCNNDDLEESFGQSNGNKKITAIFESEPQARTSATDEGIFAWVEGDQIGVWTGNNFSAFTLADGKNTSEATFTGLVNENSTLSGYAVYPYSEEYSHSYVNDKLTITLPAEYGKSNDSYQPNTNAAMIAEISSVSDKMTLRFKHVGGVFRYVVKNVPKGAAKFVFTAEDKNVTGSFEVVEEGGESVIKLDETEPTDDDAVKSNTVTINFKPLEEAAAEMRFYIPVPTGTYGKTTVDVQDKNGTSLGKITDTPKEGTFKLERRDLILAPNKIFPSVGGTLVEDQTVTTDTEATTALAKTTSDPTVSLLPSASVGEFNLGSGFTAEGTTQSQAVVNYNNGVPATITVSQSGYSADATNPPATAAVSKGKVSISVDTDNITTTDGAVATMQTLNYNTPDLTGEIEATGEKDLNITTANIHTSSTTMIFGERVKVGTLNVKGGNVVIKGSVTKIEDARQNKSLPIYIVKEGNGIVSETLPEGFYYVNSREEAALRSAFDMATATAATFVLPADVDITQAGKALELGADKKLILDLNGHTIKASGSKTQQILVNGTLTIQDNSSTKTGKIVETTGYSATCQYNVLRAESENAKIIMAGGTISFESGVKNFGVGLREGADFEMTGGKIEAGYYALAGNGDDKTTASTISISNGELISTTDYAIFLPQKGETTISGGTIKGACGAIGVRNGTLNVKENAELISDGTGSTGDWKDGTGNSGNAVIAVGTGTAKTYGDCKVNLDGGTFTANGDAVGVLKGESTTHSITINVKGGTFNDPRVLNYLTENANNVNVILTKDVEVDKIIIVKNGVATLNLKKYTISNTADIWNADETVRNWSVISVRDNATLTIETDEEGGAIIAKKDDCYACDTQSANATLNIKGGLFKGNVSVVYSHPGTINIYGGTFMNQQAYKTNDPNHLFLNCWDDEYGKSAIINVSGGTFHGFNPQKNTAEGVNTNFLKSGLVVETEKDVFEVLPEVNGEVTLTEDLTLYSPIFTTKNVTLNLGNHHLSDGGIKYIKDVQAALIEVYGGELTIKGTGSVKSNATADNYAVFVRNDAIVNIEDGVYEGSATAVNVHMGTANIKGGTYSQVGYNSHNYVINCYDANYTAGTAKVSISGGTFVGFDPSDTKNEPKNPTSYVASGYTVTADTSKDITVYTVTAE